MFNYSWLWRVGSVYKDFINKNDIVNVKLVGRDDSRNILNVRQY